MATQRTRVDLADGEVVIKGKIGGRVYEYSGALEGFVVEVDDGIDEEAFIPSRYTPVSAPITTYSFTFKEKDGKTLTVRQHKKVVKRTARTEFGNESHTDKDAIDKYRREVGAPDDAVNYFSHNTIVFAWEEEV